MGCRGGGLFGSNPRQQSAPTPTWQNSLFDPLEHALTASSRGYTEYALPSRVRMRDWAYCGSGMHAGRSATMNTSVCGIG